MKEIVLETLKAARTEAGYELREAKSDLAEYEEVVSEKRRETRQLEDKVAELTVAIGDDWKVEDLPERDKWNAMSLAVSCLSGTLSTIRFGEYEDEHEGEYGDESDD